MHGNLDNQSKPGTMLLNKAIYFYGILKVVYFLTNLFFLFTFCLAHFKVIL